MNRKFALAFILFQLMLVLNIHAQVPRINGNTYVQCASFEYGRRTELEVRGNKIFISMMPNGKLGYTMNPGSFSQLNQFLNYAGSNNGWYIFTDYWEQSQFYRDPSKFATWVYINKDASRVRVSGAGNRWNGKDGYWEYRIWNANEDVNLGPTN